jgi:inner membrane protein
MDLNLTPGVIWLLAGLALLGLEIAAPGAFMMWLGIAAVATGLTVLVANVGFGPQVALFTIFAAISLVVGLRLRQRVRPPLNTQGSGLAGRSAVALAFQGREGRVRLGDSDWAARLPSGVEPPDPGTRLRVEGVDGTVLIVQPE